MATPETLSGIFLKGSDDITAQERDTKLRQLLLILMSKQNARVKVEYAQGNFNIGNGYYKTLSIQDVQKSDMPLPQTEIQILIWENNQGMGRITLDLDPRRTGKAIVIFQQYGGLSSHKLPVTTALEYVINREQVSTKSAAPVPD